MFATPVALVPTNGDKSNRIPLLDQIHKRFFQENIDPHTQDEIKGGPPFSELMERMLKQTILPHQPRMK
jgi:hypothetical protein